MRTTIEIRDDLRAELLALAARRGKKGFSGLVEEAIEAYLKLESGRQEAIRKALTFAGSIDEETAEHMRATVRRLRSHWR